MILVVSATPSDGFLIVASIFAVIVVLILAYWLYRSIHKERKRYINEKANYIDGLTDKVELASEVSAYMSRSTAVEFSFMYIDIDKFSAIINTFGQEVSDELLEKIAYNILDALPTRVSLTRLKQDKFVAFIRGEYDRGDVIQIANDVLSRLVKPMKVYGNTNVNLTASIGISYYPVNGKSYEKLLESARIAVYLAKKEGGNLIKVYSNQNSGENVNLEYYNQIKEAIKKKEFCLYYQPMINSSDGSIYGFEGLMRWNHPDYGILPPYKFINFMEQSGDIQWVGLWGIDVLIDEYLKLIAAYPGFDPKMSINLSPKQLLDSDLATNFQKILNKHKLLAKKLILEIGEFALFDNHKIIKNNLEILRAEGFLIAVDGMGLDYNTLIKLEELPIDIVKVSREFLLEDDNNYLQEKYASMLVEYASKESKTVICEGIETPQMFNKLKKYGVEYVQGYYFAKPMNEDDLIKYIATEDWKKKIKDAANAPIIEKDTSSVEVEKSPLAKKLATAKKEVQKEDTVEVISPDKSNVTPNNEEANDDVIEKIDSSDINLNDINDSDEEDKPAIKKEEELKAIPKRKTQIKTEPKAKSKTTSKAKSKTTSQAKTKSKAKAINSTEPKSKPKTVK